MRFLCQFNVLTAVVRLVIALGVFLPALGGVFAANSDEFPVNLLFSKKDVPKILAKTKLPIFKETWKKMSAPNQGKRRNFVNDAFVYALTGDPQKGESARQGVLETLNKEDWDVFLENNKYRISFLTGAMTTTNMALAYDWIYDLLTPDEREQVLDAIAEKGCVPLYRALYGMRYPETVKGWSVDPAQGYYLPVDDMSRWPVILSHNNYRAVLSGGLTLGMYTLQGRDDRFDDWRELIMDSYARFTELIAQDGSYDEGVSYCNYAMTHLIHVMTAIENKEGIDLFDDANYMGMMNFDLGMFMPYDQNPTASVNFGDAGGSLDSGIGFWIAAKSKDGLSQYIAENYTGRHDLFSIIYYDPEIKPTPPVNTGYLYKTPFDWIVTRTGYTTDDLVVALRSGPPLNHEHSDRNSVILKYAGEVLLADTYRPTYDPTKPGWLLRTSAAHNTVRIDDQDQQYHHGEEGTNAGKACAHLVRWGEREGYTFWASDATNAYSLVDPDVKSVTRTTLIFKDAPCIINIDKIIKDEKASLFETRWFTENRDEKAECSGSGNSFTITRPNAKFYGKVAGSPEMSASPAKLPLADSLGVYPYIDIKAAKKAQNGLIIMAGAPLKSGEKAPEITITNDGNVWTAKIVKKRKKILVRIFDQNTLPEFEVVSSGL